MGGEGGWGEREVGERGRMGGEEGKGGKKAVNKMPHECARTNQTDRQTDRQSCTHLVLTQLHLSSTPHTGEELAELLTHLPKELIQGI